MNASMDFRISQEIATYGNAWFDKDRIVAKVVASYGKLPSIKGLDLGATLGWYVKSRVTSHLQTHDGKGCASSRAIGRARTGGGNVPGLWTHRPC